MPGRAPGWQTGLRLSARRSTVDWMPPRPARCAWSALAPATDATCSASSRGGQTPAGLPPSWSSTTPGWPRVLGRPPRRCPHGSKSDAAQSDVYVRAVPADLVLLCGIFGNVSDDDVRVTVEAAPQLCARGAEVVWTRHRGDPDLTPSIRGWFVDAGFEEVAFVAPPEHQWSVGVHRLVADPRPLEPGRHWFTFFR